MQDQSIENRLVSMVIPKFHLLQIEWEFLFRNTVKFVHSLLRVAPEAVRAINMNTAPAEPSPVIDGEMFVAGKNQRVITSPSVRIDD